MTDDDILAALEDARIRFEDADAIRAQAELQRAEAITEALGAGWSLRRIAEAAGVSHQSVRNIADRHEAAS